MDTVELLQKVNDRYQTALAFHRESADLFCFLSLDGFAALHEFQYFDEAATARHFKQYVIQTHGIPMYDSGPEGENIFKKHTNGMERDAIDANQIWKILADAWKVYREWEIGTKEAYSTIAAELLKDGAVSDYEVVSSMVRDVTKELQDIDSLIMDMKGTDFDLPHISDLQLPLEEKYTRKLRHLYKEKEPLF